jgi:potassium-transporting ATPase KdpC subunit
VHKQVLKNRPETENSGGTNWGPTNQKLIDRVKTDVAYLQADNPGQPVPVDLVTASGSGLDPNITPATAEFQAPRVARARGLAEAEVRRLVRMHTHRGKLVSSASLGRIVLELNLALDSTQAESAKK